MEISKLSICNAIYKMGGWGENVMGVNMCFMRGMKAKREGEDCRWRRRQWEG